MKRRAPFSSHHGHAASWKTDPATHMRWVWKAGVELTRVGRSAGQKTCYPGHPHTHKRYKRTSDVHGPRSAASLWPCRRVAHPGDRNVIEMSLDSATERHRSRATAEAQQAKIRGVTGVFPHLWRSNGEVCRHQSRFSDIQSLRSTFSHSLNPCIPAKSQKPSVMHSKDVSGSRGREGSDLIS